MINPQSRSLEWITEVAQRMGIRDHAQGNFVLLT